jgi:hypothetical protein
MLRTVLFEKEAKKPIFAVHSQSVPILVCR